MELWNESIANFPTACRWIVAGDFNMVENKEDMTSSARDKMINKNKKWPL